MQPHCSSLGLHWLMECHARGGLLLCMCTSSAKAAHRPVSQGRMSHEMASTVKAWNTRTGREVVSVARELLGGNGIVNSFLVAKARCALPCGKLVVTQNTMRSCLLQARLLHSHILESACLTACMASAMLCLGLAILLQASLTRSCGAQAFCDMEAYHSYEGTYEVNVLVSGRGACLASCFPLSHHIHVWAERSRVMRPGITGVSAIKAPASKGKPAVQA